LSTLSECRYGRASLRGDVGQPMDPAGALHLYARATTTRRMHHRINAYPATALALPPRR